MYRAHIVRFMMDILYDHIYSYDICVCFCIYDTKPDIYCIDCRNAYEANNKSKRPGEFENHAEGVTRQTTDTEDMNMRGDRGAPSKR